MNREVTIEVPVKLVKKMSNAVKITEDFINEFEDFILSKDKKILDKIYKAREEHLSGCVKPLSELKNKYV
ncbi:MAG: hypothetical protein AABY84_10015 [Candidatus Firestonebacteria bacterium]